MSVLYAAVNRVTVLELDDLVQGTLRRPTGGLRRRSRTRAVLRRLSPEADEQLSPKLRPLGPRQY